MSCVLSDPHFFAVKIVIIRLISHACFLSYNRMLPSPILFVRGLDKKFNVSAKLISAWNGGVVGAEGGGGIKICLGADDGSVGCIGCWEGGGDDGGMGCGGVTSGGATGCWSDDGAAVVADMSANIVFNLVI